MNHANPLLAFSCALLLGACGTPDSASNVPAANSPLQNPNTDSGNSDSGNSDSGNAIAGVALGEGLNAQYFNSINFTGPSLKRREASTNFAWGNGSPASSIGSDRFSARYSGTLIAPRGGTYRFYLTSDDGARLSLGTKVVTNDFNVHAPRTIEGNTILSAGQRIPLKLEYYENDGGATLKLEWSGPGLSRAVIPAANLSASGTTPPVTPPVTPPTTSPTPPTGQTYFIAPNGNDDNPGSEAQPWLRIHKAVGTLNAGETVLIKNGTYTGGLYIQRSGLPGKPITFKAFPGASPVVNVNQSTSGAFLEGVSYVNIDGLDFDYNFPGAESANGTRGEAGIMIQNAPNGTRAHHIGIFNNKVHGFPGGGIGSNLADYITIRGNKVWVNALWSFYDGSGVSLYRSINFDDAPGDHNVISGNMIFNNENRVPDFKNKVITDGNCIIIDDSRNTQHEIGDPLKDKRYTAATLIENNICAGNGGGGLRIYSSDNVLARHNTLFQNQITSTINAGEMTAYDASNVRFTHNIVYATPGKRANGTGNATNITYEGNLYFGTTDIPMLTSSDLIADPLFEAPSANLSSANFRLRPNSPAIDRASSGQSPTTDIAAGPRPLGAGADLGAWEIR